MGKRQTAGAGNSHHREVSPELQRDQPSTSRAAYGQMREDSRRDERARSFLDYEYEHEPSSWDNQAYKDVLRDYREQDKESNYERDRSPFDRRSAARSGTQWRQSARSRLSDPRSWDTAENDGYYGDFYERETRHYETDRYGRSYKRYDDDSDEY